MFQLHSAESSIDPSFFLKSLKDIFIREGRSFDLHAQQDAPYCNICSGVRESDFKVSLTSVGNCLRVQLNCFFVSNGTVTKNSAPFFVSSPIEVVTEIEDEVFCARKFNLAAVINHSGSLNSGHYTCLVKDGETRWHCNDKAVVRVNLDLINKSLLYVLFYQAK